MKTFFTKKRIAFLTMDCISLLTLVVILIVPIGSLNTKCFIYLPYTKSFGTLLYDDLIMKGLSSPFTFGSGFSYRILVVQTIVFTLVSIVFVVFFVLFSIELKRAGVFAHRPTKAERMQAQIDELQKQVDELKQDK